LLQKKLKGRGLQKKNAKKRKKNGGKKKKNGWMRSSQTLNTDTLR
jgi:hypothetical protein